LPKPCGYQGIFINFETFDSFSQNLRFVILIISNFRNFDAIFSTPEGLTDDSGNPLKFNIVRIPMSVSNGMGWNVIKKAEEVQEEKVKVQPVKPEENLQPEIVEVKSVAENRQGRRGPVPGSR